MIDENILGILWALLRPQTYLLMLVYVAFGFTYGLTTTIPHQQLGNFDIQSLVLVILALAFWYIAGTAFNDYADYEIDKINLKGDKQRPLVTGSVNKSELLRIALLSSAISFILVALTNNFILIGLFVLMLLLNTAYSLPPVQISHRGGLAPLLLPLGYIVLTLTSGFVLSGATLTSTVVVLIGGMYLHFLSRIVLKDHRDVVGDKKMGKKTLVIKYGNKFVSTLSMTLFVISTILLMIVLWPVIKNGFFFVLMLASGAIAMLHSLTLEERWEYQKPIITMYGRLCSGMITLLIFNFVAYYLDIPARGATLTMTALVIIFFLSLIDIKRLQQPTSLPK